MKDFIRILLFDCCRKEERDPYGWWQVEAGLTVIIWLLLASMLLRVIEALCST